MQIHAHLNHLHIAPRKVRLVANLIKGMETEQAALELRHRTKRAAGPLMKLLYSAIANAKNNFQIHGGLYIKKITVGEGPTAKRYRARAFGRAAPIRKRTSHVSLVLETKEEVKIRPPKRKKKEGPVIRDLTAKDHPTGEEMPREKQSPKVGRAARIRTPGFVRRMFRRKAI